MAVLALVVYLMGGDPTVSSTAAGRDSATDAGAPSAGAPGAPRQDQMSQFVSVVLADTEDTWQSIFKQKFGRDYEDPKLVLFTAPCSPPAASRSRPWARSTVPTTTPSYIDLAFYREMKERFGAPGDFAQAYVIAHEVAPRAEPARHSDKVQAAQQRSDKAGANALSVRLELQADCYGAASGAITRSARRNILEARRRGRGPERASAIGDDKMQKAARGYVVPSPSPHGSSAQRQQWFRRGFESGNLEACDTFSKLGDEGGVLEKKIDRPG
jgi:predicted metalloprotease